ncbi:hypothetical protein RBB77_01700 [Tunturibacter psychrotolerans]|uniref:Uncharacterized protein n=1 Tax=Tunturiibacter psychrotolerans TaxID=3069686 RepID=A0AAU7ZRL2_9BACT
MMPKKAAETLPKFINISFDTLDLTLENNRRGEVSVSTETMSSPMWELVYFNFMYCAVHAKDKKKGGPKVSYSLLPPPVWLVGIGTLIWQGILQGASWEFVKIAIAKGLDKLREKGLVSEGKIGETTLNAGWIKYSSSGKKQYEMYVSLKKTFKKLPDKHPEAYARSKDRKEFGQIIRGELDKPATVAQIPKKKAAKNAGATRSRRQPAAQAKRGSWVD